MGYSIEPRDRRYVKGYGFLPYAENIGKNVSNKYSEKLVDSAIMSGATKVATDAMNTASKSAAEATGDLIGNKIDDKITSVSKKPTRELHLKKLHDEELKSDETNNEILKERYIPPKKDNKLLMN